MITMFHADMAFSLELMVLVLAAALLIWAKLHANLGTGFAKFIGYLVVILAILGLACTSYYTVQYWSEGYFSPQTINQRFQTKKCSMMGKCMMNNMKMDMKNNMQCGSGNMPQMKQMMNQQNMPNMQKMQGQMPMDKNSKTMPMQQPQKMQKTQETPANNAEHDLHHN